MVGAEPVFSCKPSTEIYTLKLDVLTFSVVELSALYGEKILIGKACCNLCCFTFGELSGYVCDEDGNKYILDGMSAIGEDKSLHF